MTLDWKKCQNKDDAPHWCSFTLLNSTSFAEGVYIVWLGKNVIYVGQGNILARVKDHRDDERFLEYDTSKMRVTFASVSSGKRDGVERWLAEQLDPLIGEVWPLADPIAVNLPWG